MMPCGYNPLKYIIGGSIESYSLRSVINVDHFVQYKITDTYFRSKGVAYFSINGIPVGSIWLHEFKQTLFLRKQKRTTQVPTTEFST
jgi:hypothetical protein